jgi:hypothetical protein
MALLHLVQQDSELQKVFVAPHTLTKLESHWVKFRSNSENRILEFIRAKLKGRHFALLGGSTVFENLPDGLQGPSEEWHFDCIVFGELI